MIKFNKSMWFMALLLVVFLAGCGGGGGGGGAAAGEDPVIPPVIPGECPEAGPAVTSSNPADGDLNVSISTVGVLNDGKLITATFSEEMDPLTIESATPGALLTFTIKETVSGNDVPGTVGMNTEGTIATFTTSAPLLIETEYTVTITVAAQSALDNTPLGCEYEWSFTTAEPLAIDLGSAESFGIASRAGITSSGVTVVNGDIALYSLATCTDSTGGPGSASADCTGSTTWASLTGMTVNGSIYWAGGPDNDFAEQVTNDLRDAWLEGMAKVATFDTSSLSGQLAGQILKPGIYHETVLNLAAGGTCQIDAEGNANAVFIIKVDSDFTDSGIFTNPSQIELIGSAQARNVWFVIGGAVTIGTGTTWNGNILAGGTLSISGGSTVVGRLLAGAAGAGAFTMTTTPPEIAITVTVPE